MAFDQPTRNLLQRTVTACRRILDREFTAQLQELYGIQPEGSLTPVAALDHLGDEALEVARLLRERINHLAGGAAAEALTRATGRPEHIARVVREQAFTVLNRLAALRLCEERGLVLECVRHGVNSEGFQLFRSSAGNALGETHEAYRVYLHCLFDELALDLGVLFDRFSPLALLFPRHAALVEVLNELNGSGTAAGRDALPPGPFAEIWQADETIGWIYQYYNDETERKKMREESAAPRNSRELAVRNQFFTPRYVVEFLTDNTLGRLWYEMTQGNTKLKEQCRYLVRRPNEVFLKPGDEPPQNVAQTSKSAVSRVSKPADATTSPAATKSARPADLEVGDTAGLETCATNSPGATNASPSPPSEGGAGRGEVGSSNPQSAIANPQSQEDLLKQPVHIPHRPLKDPRTILMLDPACGSMHFGLYAFDLFEVIYDEAWALEEKLGADALSRPPGMKSLHDTYAGKDAFLKDVPRLIIEHNLHGIDIDPRCAQIAGLSLWLRAQKAWQRLGLKPAERPAIKRSNIVCAEPMPGEKELLREFVEREFPAAERAVCLRLLEAIFDKMQLAGEAGSLLKIEEEIRSAIEDARDAWQKLATKPPELFTTTELNQLSTAPELTGLEQAVSSLTTDPRHLTTDFWERIEERIYAALRDYAEQAENGGGFQRRLFAEDAARGFAFIDVCRKRYDVALMNPPFGDAPKSVEGLLKRWHPGVPNDLYCQFVQRGGEFTLPSAGKTGCITNSSFILYNDFQSYRQFLMSKHSTNVMLDLGEGVLDAYVGAAAYVYDPHRPSCDTLWVTDLRKVEDKATASLESVTGHNVCELPTSCSIRQLSAYELIPAAPLCHWAPDSLWKVVANTELLDRDITEAGVGAAPVADFFRVRWEIPLELFGFGKKWVALANAGYFATYYRDDYLVVNWQDGGRQAKADLNVRYPYLKGNVGLRVQRQEWYGKPGLVFGRRTDRFTTQPLCAGSMFSFNGIAVFPSNELMRDVMLALLNSRFVAYYINLICGLHKNDVYVRRLPRPRFSEDENRTVASNTRALVQLQREGHATVEVSNWFVKPALADSAAFSLRRQFSNWRSSDRRKEIEFIALRLANDLAFERTLGVDDALIQEIDRDQGPDAARFPKIETISREQAVDAMALAGPRFRDELAKDDDAQSSDSLRVAFALHCSPAAAAAALDRLELIDEGDFKQHCGALVSWLAGVAFGRWDIRYATGEQAAPELPDPFAPLPVCPPGQLQNAQGLPARPEDVPAAYPVRIPWDGILVDDPNHPLDVERRVREVIEIIWGGSRRGDEADGPSANEIRLLTSAATPEAIEHEACEILGVKSLRDYFRKPAGFFADHLKRYSKSRRQAPIYWPLSTASGSYTLWIYYHRLTDQTLYKCIQQFIDPRLADVEKELAHLRSVLDSGEGSTKTRRQLDDAEQLRTELKEMRAELEHWASRWKPNLNDGVLITACPLWKLFRLPKWRKDLETCWKELEAGDYDWAHLAHTLWPDRVRAKCKTDRSLAIAHGLEELCAVKAPEKKVKQAKKQKDAPEAELDMGN